MPHCLTSFAEGETCSCRYETQGAAGLTCGRPVPDDASGYGLAASHAAVCCTAFGEQVSPKAKLAVTVERHRARRV